MSVGEIAEKYMYFYQYMYAQLVQANLKKDSQYAQKVLAMLNELRNAWAQIIAQGYQAADDPGYSRKIAQ